MNALEHPEQALDRALAGTLGEAERGLLERHLEVCAACKAHLVLANAAEMSLQSLPADHRHDLLNIDHALARAVGRSRPFGSLTARRPFWLGAAAAVAIGGIASAAWQYKAQAQRHLETKALASGTDAPTIADVAPVYEGQPRPIRLPMDAPTGASVVASAPLIPSASASADALFRKASALRANGESDAAVAVFFTLQKRFPESREGQLSRVIAGRLLLDRGDATQALDEFNQYLARGGAASEDALAGRAAALQALGRTEAEASAWKRLLAEYPESVYENRARERLSEVRQTTSGATDSTTTR